MTTHAPSGAATAVFTINEILEIIISKLPAGRVLQLQAVATSWRDTVKRSTAVRKAICQGPEGNRNNPEKVWVIGPHRIDRFHTTVVIERHAAISTIQQDECYAVAGAFNDLILEAGDSNWISRADCPELGPDVTRRIGCGACKICDMRRRFYRGEVLAVKNHLRRILFQDSRSLSCDDTFLCVPPVKRVHLGFSGLECIGHHYIIGPLALGRVEVTNPGGVRVRDIRSAGAVVSSQAKSVLVQFPSSGYVADSRRENGAPIFLTKLEEEILECHLQNPYAWSPGKPH